MERQRLSLVEQYVKLRWSEQNNAVQLANFFTPDGCVIDAEGVEHRGFNNLVDYYNQPTPTATEVKDPIMISDGRVLVEFSVVKFMMTWNLKAYFEFAENTQRPLLHRVRIERPGFFS